MSAAAKNNVAVHALDDSEAALLIVDVALAGGAGVD